MHTKPDVLALLALGEHVAEPAEHEHLTSCDQCRAELAAFTRLIEQGRTAIDGETVDAPSDAVWAAIQAELGFIPVTRSWPTAPGPSDAEQPPPSAGGAAPRAPTDRPVRRGHHAIRPVLAAVLALIVGIGIGIGVERVRQPTDTVIGHATLEALPSWPGATGTATVDVDAAGNRTLIVELHTPQHEDGDQQVWLVNTTVTGMRSIGFLNADGRGRWPVPPGLDLAAFPIVDVSDEPANDTDVAHSGNSIARGEFQR